MATAVDICNIALSRIGEQPISSLSENVAGGIACNLVYEHCRDVLLESFPWSFAKRRASLAEVTDGGTDAWAYGYVLPTDFLSAREVWSGIRSSLAASRIPFEIEQNADGTGQMLVSDDATGDIIYTARVTDTALFPPLFQDALAYLIAAEIALSVPIKADLSNNMRIMYERTVTKAAALNINQGHELTLESEFITGRE